MYHAQLSNAFVEAYMNNEQVVIEQNSWAQKLLKLFCDDDEGFRRLETSLGFHVGDITTWTNNHNVTNVRKRTGRQLFFNSTQYKERAEIENQFIFTIFAFSKLEACSSIKHFGLDKMITTGTSTSSKKDKNIPNTPYTVIHSRWMRNIDPNCLVRLKMLAEDRWNKTHVQIDTSSPCDLPPDYIRYILSQNNMGNDSDTIRSKSPIYVITDGFNPMIVQRLMDDPFIGSRVVTVPNHSSWVVGDMMLGALSDVFIGSPTSTLALNIAKMRVSVGFDQNTNYLIPLEREKNESEWKFIPCNSTLAHCQYIHYGNSVPHYSDFQ